MNKYFSTAVLVLLVGAVVAGVNMSKPSVVIEKVIPKKYPHSRSFVLNERLKALQRAQQANETVSYTLTVAGSVGVPGSTETK